MPGQGERECGRCHTMFRLSGPGLDHGSAAACGDAVLGRYSWALAGIESTARGSFDGLPVGVFDQCVWGATSKLAHVRPRIWSRVPTRYTLCVGPAGEAVYSHR